MSPKRRIARKLVPHARAARENGRHYADFKVGCVGYGPNGKMYFGANIKETPEANPICAEEIVMRQAMEDGVILEELVVTGVPRKEDTTKTLHCCGERCLPRMKMRIKEGTAVKSTTHITCVNVVTHDVEEFTVESLMKAHGMSLDD